MKSRDEKRNTLDLLGKPNKFYAIKVSKHLLLYTFLSIQKASLHYEEATLLTRHKNSFLWLE